MSLNRPHVMRPAALAAVLCGSAALAAAQTHDLNVTLIERTPKYNYDAVPNMPQPDDAVTFHGHIRHWGDANTPTLASVEYAWKIDGQIVATGTLSNLEPLKPPFTFDYTGYLNPGSDAALRDPNNWPKNPAAFPAATPPVGWRVVTLPWIWDAGRHTVELVVDPDGLVPETSEKNNKVVDYTDALSAAFWVEETTWRYFHLYQHELPGQGRNSWEDWIQAQMGKQNELYEDAVWDVAPAGCVDRVRIDRIIVVPDNQLPINGGLPTNNPDSSDKTIDLQWGFEAYDDANSTFYDDHTSLVVGNPFYIETSLIHELGHARYLIDGYGFNVHNVVAITENGVPIAGTDYMPWIWYGDLLYLNHAGGVMTGSYGFEWSPYEAAMLNRIGGQRARCGNMNSPCNIGEYLQELPQNNHFVFTSAYGWPRHDVNVRIYQATSGGPGWYSKFYDDVYDLEFDDEDSDGWVNLGRNPFTRTSTGYEPPISHGYGLANSTLVARIQQGAQVWFRFIEASDFNLEYYKGNLQNAYYAVELDGPNDDSDGDNLPDYWELTYFPDLARDGSGDADEDGLTEFTEFQKHTDPTDTDTDDDGLDDYAEVYVYGTSPLEPDSDADGLDDGAEVALGTFPLNPDSDADGHLDGADNCPLIANPDQADFDGDGIGDACAPGPRIDYAFAPRATLVALRFSSPVEQASAENASNYTLTGGALVLAATREPDQRGVLLATTSLTPDTAYTVTVSNVYDTEDPPHVIVPGSDFSFIYSTAPRAATGLAALYTFDEGAGSVVNDTSGFGLPLPLAIAPAEHVQWTTGGLIFASGPGTAAASATAASKIIAACKASNEVTFEAWIRPANAIQAGPARILTLSTSDSSRNCTLGQEAGVYEARLRTTETNFNGTPGVFSPAGAVLLQTHHVVYTRDAAGAARLYLNGVLVADEVRGGSLSNWSSSTRLALGNEFNRERLWLGEYRLIAIYSRALSAAEVSDNFLAGPDPLPVLTGDMNCSGSVDFADINPFVLALTSPAAYAAAYPACDRINGDINGNGSVGFDDINPFVALLTGN